MRARAERVSLAVTGTAIRRGRTGPARRRLTVQVNGIATTHTDVAVLRNPVALELQLSRTPDDWRVVDFDGGPS